MAKVHTFILIAIAGIFSALDAVNADVVIHRPDANPVDGTSQIVSATVLGASAIGVESNGATKYVVTEVDSLVALASGTVTQTVLSTPLTTVYTFAEGASVYSISSPVETTLAGISFSVGVEVKCTGTGGGANCVQVGVLSASDQNTATTATFGATMVPIFTFKSSAAAAAPTSTSGGDRVVVSFTFMSVTLAMGVVLAALF